MKKQKKPKEKKIKIKRNLNYESQNFLGKVVVDPSGKKRISLNSPPLYQTFINNMCKIGDDISMYVTNTKPKRSERQNRYLHVYLSLICLANEGNTIEDLKDWIHQYHLVEKISIIKGVEVKTCKSTANLKIGEFCDMLAWVEKETEIPLPDTEPFLKPLSWEEFNELREEQRRVYSKLVMKKI